MSRDNNPPRFSRVCVYCGSSNAVDDRYKSLARELGTLLGNQGMTLVYGGGRVGLMGIVADATLEAGGQAIGIIPRHIQDLEVEHTGLTELHIVENMHTRKQMMVERADAFIILPGGLGTLDETFEILTWKQLRLHDKPIIILNMEGFWSPLIGLVEHLIGQGFAKPEHRELFSEVASVDGILDALSQEPPEMISPESKWM